jgi:hypothetical protein
MGIFGGKKKKGNGGGDPPDLDFLIERGMNGLGSATAMHDATWHLGEADWAVDQDLGTIVFTTAKIRAEAPVQIIGTYNPADSTWLWGWDHPSVLPALAANAKTLLEYGKKHGHPRLTTRKLSCSEKECWELTALAFHLCEANGAYRGPAGETLVFVTFGEISLSKAS